MKPRPKSSAALLQENARLRARLQEAGETLRAIRAGEVDGLLMDGRVYTLQSAETPYRILVETMNEGAGALAPNGVVLYCNGRLASLLRAPVRDLIGVSLRGFVAPADLPAFDALLAQSNQTSCQGEVTLQRPDGAPVPVQLSLTGPLGGGTPGVGVVVADLTERRQAEATLRQAQNALEQRVAERTAELEAANAYLEESRRAALNLMEDAMAARQEAEQANAELRASEERFRLFMDNSPTIAWIRNARGRYVYVSKTYEAQFGGRPCPGRSRSAAFIKESRQNDLAVLAGGQAIQRVEETVGAAGSRCFWLTTRFPFCDAAGHRFVAGIGLDITGRKRDREHLEQALREKQEALALLDALFNAAPIGLAFLDRNLRFVRLNRALAGMNGLPVEAHLGKTLKELVPDVHDVAKITRTWRRIIQTGGPVMNAEVSGQTAGRSGDIRFWIENWFPVKVDGQIIGLGTTVLDNTERKRAELELQQLNKHLEEIVAERTAVARQRTAQLQKTALELTLAEQRERQRMAAVLHDGLQQLLYAAEYEAQFLARHVNHAGGQESLKRLNERLSKAIASCRDLNWDLSPPLLRQGGFGQALKWLAQWMRDTHRLTVDVRTKGVPRLSESSRVLLFQAARELLFNVVKHAKGSSAALTLERLDRQSVQLTVRDFGVGKPSIARTRQGKSRLGWGLSNLKDRVEFVGGSLTVDPALGAGMTVTVCLPVAAAIRLGSEARSGQALRGGPAPADLAAPDPTPPR